MLKKITLGGALLLSAGLLVTANAQQTPPTPEQIAEGATSTRQAVFKLLSYNMGAISGMARGTVEFNADVAVRNANRIENLATMIPELFNQDTREFAVNTQALPIIWDSRSDFAEKAANLEEAARAFAAVASGGDQQATAAAVRAFGATCGNCHDTYRVSQN